MPAFFFTLATAAPVIWVLAVFSVAPLALAAYFIRHPGALAKGQDAAGRGMAVGCTVAILGAISLVLSIVNAIVTAAANDPLDTITRVAGFGPLIAIVFTALGVYTVSQLRKGE